MTLIKVSNTPNINSGLIGTEAMIGSLSTSAPIVPMSLNFDGVNDFTRNNPGTPFTEREYTQPRTFYCSFFKPAVWWWGLFASRPWWWTQPWLYIWLEVFWGGRYIIASMRWSNWSLMQPFVFPVSIPPGKSIIQITHDWSWLGIAGTRFYLNGVQLVTSWWGSVTASIINWLNTATIWFAANWFSTPRFTGRMQRLSFVDYVKTLPEIVADDAAGFQSVWTWNYLFVADMDRTTWLSFPASDSWGLLTMDISWQPVWDWQPFC